MPDTLSLSAGVSLGLLAGIVSGVCYFVANGISWPKSDLPQYRRCISSGEEDGVCRRCGGDTRGGIVPCICRYHKPVKFESGAWFLRQVQRAVSLMPWSISTDQLEQIEEEECEDRESPGPSQGQGELRNVREFLETLSAQLAGGALESTRVAPLYDHPAYLPAPRDASPSLGARAPSDASGAHVQLKRLVARVVEEAASMPALARYAAEPPPAHHASYEDLLATAILNKVIERYQTENGSGGRSSGIHSASASPSPSERSSPRSLHSHHHTREISPPLREEDVSDWEEGTDDALELPRRVPFPEFGEDVVRHENTQRDFDEVSGSDIQAIDGTWEENWLFQKKKIKTIQSVPVPMLVPNSNADYRALIGDRDADDTTDLSDNASDPEEDQDEHYKSAAKNVLDSKHIIGGKPRVDEMDFEPDSLTIIDGNDFEADTVLENDHITDAVNNELNDIDIKISEKVNKNVNEPFENGHDSILILDIDSGPLSKTEFSIKEEIHRKMLNRTVAECFDELDAKIAGNNNDDALDSLSSLKGSTNNTLNRQERVGEYEETVTMPVQRYADSLRRKHFDDETQHIPVRDTDKDIDDLIPGSIAYRERKKWLNYVEMPNNPYSPEAIKKRLSAKSTSSLFDMITTKSKELDDEKCNLSMDVVDGKTKIIENDEIPVKESPDSNSPPVTINGEKFHLMNGIRSESPSAKKLKDVIVEEVPQYKRYGRDYYIKEAKTSAGSRKKTSLSDTSSMSSLNKSTSLDNFDTELTPGILITQFNTIAATQQYTKFAVNEPTKESISTMPSGKDSQILIEYEDTNEDAVFLAKPAYVNDDETDNKFEEILKSAYSNSQALEIEGRDIDEPTKSPSNLSGDNSYISSSSLEDSIKIYNVQTGEIVKCKPEDNVSRYETVADTNANIDIPDNNVLGETDDKFSQNIEANEDTVEIQDRFDDEEEEDLSEKNSEVDDILAQLPKVKELAKKFVSMDNINEPAKPHPYSWRRRSKENILNGENIDKPTSKLTYMHSLTARSISREFREELKLSMATPLTVPGGSKEMPEGTDEVTKESSRPGSPLPEPGTLKTKLAFFESLKSKFSSK